MSTTTAATLTDQADRLVALGVHDLAGLNEADFRSLVPEAAAGSGPVLVVHPDVVPASWLAPLLSRGGKPGFVVVDMTDLDEFAPIEGVEEPDAPFYVVDGLDRGDDLRNASPAEALAVLTERGRRALTLNEGICWLLQEPDQLEPNHCFMTVASRKRGRGVRSGGTGFDARVPAIWISGGTGRDGKERKGAPKVGWCWENNRHTWLGFASCTSASA